MTAVSIPPRDNLEIDWAFFGELCRALSLHVARDYDPEVVIGIARTGVIPAAIVAAMLQKPFAVVAIGRDRQGAKPHLVSQPDLAVMGRRVLLVDETCDSGDTMKLALSIVGEGRPAEVRTAVSFRTGKWAPDYQAFATEKEIVLPWDSEVVVNGELVKR